MTPDDPRHGTQAGWQKHSRDGEPQCQPCIEARRAYQRRQPHLRALGAKPYARIGATALANVLELQDLTDREWVTHTGLSKEVRNRVLASGSPAYRARPHVANKLRTLNTATIRDAMLTHVGAVRRLRALARIGYSAAAVARVAGMHEDAISLLRSGDATSSSFTTRRKVAAAYSELHMTPVKRDRITARTLNTAARHKWAGPLSWDRIDDPNERPHGGADALNHDDIDSAVVARILAGEYRLSATRAEKEAVVAAWSGSQAELCRLTGWHEGRYTTRRDGAA